MKKKLLALPLACCAMFIMGACGNSGSDASVGMSVVVVSSAPQESLEAEASAAEAASADAVTTGSDEKVDNLAKELNDNVEFGEELTALDGGGLERVYHMDAADVAAAAGYTGSGATVDQISVWKGTDQAAAETIEETLQKFLETQIENYSTYMPDQVPKLEDAVLERQGEYVAFCVSEDAAAASAIISAGLGG